MKALLTALIMLPGIVCAQSSTQTVYSQVTSPSSAAPVSDVPIEIYGTSAMVFSNVPSNAVVYRLDAIRMLEMELSSGLPANQDQAQQVVAKRMTAMKDEFARRVQAAALGQMRARGYGIDRAPAIVFGEKQVVYGVTNVDEARARWVAGKALAVKGPPLPPGWDSRAARQ